MGATPFPEARSTTIPVSDQATSGGTSHHRDRVEASGVEERFLPATQLMPTYNDMPQLYPTVGESVYIRADRPIDPSTDYERKDNAAVFGIAEPGARARDKGGGRVASGAGRHGGRRPPFVAKEGGELA